MQHHRNLQKHTRTGFCFLFLEPAKSIPATTPAHWPAGPSRNQASLFPHPPATGYTARIFSCLLPCLYAALRPASCDLRPAGTCDM